MDMSLHPNQTSCGKTMRIGTLYVVAVLVTNQITTASECMLIIPMQLKKDGARLLETAFFLVHSERVVLILKKGATKSQLRKRMKSKHQLFPVRHPSILSTQNLSMPTKRRCVFK